MTCHFTEKPSPPPRPNFLEVMSRVASTVSVIATNGPAGQAGITVSSLTSVSADRANPVVLVCINRQSHAASVILDNGHFSVNILHQDQVEISDLFSGRSLRSNQDRFDGKNWCNGPSALPILEEALATLECTICESQLVGEHYVIFGEVQTITKGNRHSPLIYVDRNYRGVADLAVAAS